MPQKIQKLDSRKKRVYVFGIAVKEKYWNQNIKATINLSSSSFSQSSLYFAKKDSNHPISVDVMWALFQEPDGSANFKPKVLGSSFERYFVFLLATQYSWKSWLRISTRLSTEVPPVRYCMRATQQATHVLPHPMWKVCQMSTRWKRCAPPTDSSWRSFVHTGSVSHGNGVSKTLANLISCRATFLTENSSPKKTSPNKYSIDWWRFCGTLGKPGHHQTQTHYTIIPN